MKMRTDIKGRRGCTSNKSNTTEKRKHEVKERRSRGYTSLERRTARKQQTNIKGKHEGGNTKGWLLIQGHARQDSNFERAGELKKARKKIGIPALPRTVRDPDEEKGQR